MARQRCQVQARNAHLKCNQHIKWEEYRISIDRQELNWLYAKYQPYGNPYYLSARSARLRREMKSTSTQSAILLTNNGKSPHKIQTTTANDWAKNLLVRSKTQGHPGKYILPQREICSTQSKAHQNPTRSHSIERSGIR